MKFRSIWTLICQLRVETWNTLCLMTFNLLLAFVTLVPLPIEVGWRRRKSRRARGAFWRLFVDFLLFSVLHFKWLFSGIMSSSVLVTIVLYCKYPMRLKLLSAADKTVYFSLVHWKFTRKENKLVSKSRRIRWDAEVRVEREKQKWKTIFSWLRMGMCETSQSSLFAYTCFITDCRK